MLQIQNPYKPYGSSWSVCLISTYRSTWSVSALFFAARLDLNAIFLDGKPFFWTSTLMKLGEEFRRWHWKGCFQKRAKPSLLPLTSTARQELKLMRFLISSMRREFTKVSHRKIISKQRVHIRSQRIGIAFRLPKP